MEKTLKQILLVMVIALFIVTATSYVYVLKKDIGVETSLGGTTINKFYNVDTSATTTPIHLPRQAGTSQPGVC